MSGVVKLDYDEGNWFLTFDLHDATITVVLNDDEAMELDAALAPVRERKAEYESHKQLYRGMRQAGLTPPGRADD